jgi:hypothetical protein
MKCNELSEKSKKGRKRKSLKCTNDRRATLPRPTGYFAHCYTEEEIREDNLLAKASIIRAPSDLE